MLFLRAISREPGCLFCHHIIYDIYVSRLKVHSYHHLPFDCQQLHPQPTRQAASQ